MGAGGTMVEAAEYVIVEKAYLIVSDGVALVPRGFSDAIQMTLWMVTADTNSPLKIIPLPLSNVNVQLEIGDFGSASGMPAANCLVTTI